MKGRPALLTHMMRSLLPASADSQVLCHSLVAVSALWHLARRTEQKPDVRLLSLHGQAVASLRKALSKPSDAYSDTTIVAAVLLTHQQILLGSKVGLESQMKGIQALVNARGGFHNIGSVAALVLWVDYLSSLYTDKEPYFTWPIDPAIRLTDEHEPIYGAAFSEPCITFDLDHDIRLLCIDSCRIIELLERVVDCGQTLGTLEYYRYKRNVIAFQHAVLHARFHEKGTLDECVSLAMNMVLLKIFYMHVLQASVMDLSLKLQMALLKTDLDNFWPGQTDLLVWVLFVATSLVPDTFQDESWFLGQLRDAMAFRFEISTGSHIGSSSSLAGLPYPPVWRDYLQRTVERHAWSHPILSASFNKTYDLLE